MVSITSSSTVQVSPTQTSTQISGSDINFNTLIGIIAGIAAALIVLIVVCVLVIRKFLKLSTNETPVPKRNSQDNMESERKRQNPAIEVELEGYGSAANLMASNQPAISNTASPYATQTNQLPANSPYHSRSKDSVPIPTFTKTNSIGSLASSTMPLVKTNSISNYQTSSLVRTPSQAPNSQRKLTNGSSHSVDSKTSTNSAMPPLPNHPYLQAKKSLGEPNFPIFNHQTAPPPSAQPTAPPPLVAPKPNAPKQNPVLLANIQKAINDTPTLYFGTTNVSASQTKNTYTLGTTMIGQKEVSIPGFLFFESQGDYRNNRKIGKGGGGVIYKVDLLSPDLQKRAGDKVGVAKILESFISEDLFFQELAITWYFSSFNNFVKIYGYSTNPNVYILKYYGHGSLSPLIHESRTDKQKHVDYNKTLVFHIIFSIAKGLKEIKEAGMVHNDLKPPNILLDRKGKNEFDPIISDFGLAKIVDDSANLVHEMKMVEIKGASLLYSSPELLQKVMRKMKYKPKNLGALYQSDVYSFGCIIYEMLTRRKPWK